MRWLLASPDVAAVDQKVLLTGSLTHPITSSSCASATKGRHQARRDERTEPSVSLRSAAEGWAELQAPDGTDVRGVVYAASSGGVTRQSGVIDPRLLEGMRPHLPTLTLRLMTRRNDAQRDALALGVAEVVHADLFITERPYLFATKLPVQGVTVCKPPEALALVGLYFRSQQEFAIWRGAAGSGSFNMNEGLYFWVGTRELLPAAWRWFTACVQQSDPAGDRTLLELGESLLRRVQRALEARDRLHRAFNLPQNNDTASAVLSELDSILVSLMGAVDVSARVAHLGWESLEVCRCRWQNGQRWLPRVVTAEPALAVLFNADTSA